MARCRLLRRTKQLSVLGGADQWAGLLDKADDLTVWRYAKDNGFGSVTKDLDFHEFSLVYGNPPKVIWLKRGKKPKCY